MIQKGILVSSVLIVSLVQQRSSSAEEPTAVASPVSPLVQKPLTVYYFHDTLAGNRYITATILAADCVLSGVCFQLVWRKVGSGMRQAFRACNFGPQYQFPKTLTASATAFVHDFPTAQLPACRMG